MVATVVSLNIEARLFYYWGKHCIALWVHTMALTRSVNQSINWKFTFSLKFDATFQSAGLVSLTGHLARWRKCSVNILSLSLDLPPSFINCHSGPLGTFWSASPWASLSFLGSFVGCTCKRRAICIGRTQVLAL